MDFTEVLITPSFKNIHFSVFLSRPILLIVLGLFLSVYVVLSSIIIYHWHAYGMKSKGVYLAETVFLLVTIVLFALSAVSITYF